MVPVFRKNWLWQQWVLTNVKGSVLNGMQLVVLVVFFFWFQKCRAGWENLVPGQFGSFFDNLITLAGIIMPGQYRAQNIFGSPHFPKMHYQWGRSVHYSCGFFGRPSLFVSLKSSVNVLTTNSSQPVQETKKSPHSRDFHLQRGIFDWDVSQNHHLR